MTPKQERFVAEYLIDLNATQAAIRAGYSEDTSYSIGHENLRKPEIAQAIESAKLQRAERLNVDADWVLRKALALRNRCETEGDRTNERQTLELIGKHVEVAAFKERVDHTGMVGHYDCSEDIAAVDSMLGELTRRSERPSVQ